MNRFFNLLDKFAFHLEKRFMSTEKTQSFKIFFLLLVVFGGLFFSCANEDCVSVATNYYQIAFFDSEPNSSGNFPSIDTLFYSVVADDNDYSYYGPDTTVSVLSLPVNPAADMTSFELTMLDSISYDSLNNPIYHVNPNPHYVTLQYRRSQRIISEACGVEIFYTKIKIDQITFEDTVVVADRISRLNDANVEVYF